MNRRCCTSSHGDPFVVAEGDDIPIAERDGRIDGELDKGGENSTIERGGLGSSGPAQPSGQGGQEERQEEEHDG